MALLDLKTDLKSLKYGHDRPGGGNSGQPYIKTDINTVDNGAINKLRFSNFDDGAVRGGIIGATNASIVDTLRIGKFLKDFPKGPLFLTKQVGLQLSNPQLEHRNNFRTDRKVTLQGTNLNLQGTNLNTGTSSKFRNVTNTLINKVTGNATQKASTIINKVTGTVAQGISTAATTLANLPSRIENEIGSTRIYNLGLNTLSQVTVNAAGGHILRHGFLPTRDESRDYINVVFDNNFNNDNNRLEGYANVFLLGGFGTPNQFNDSTELTSYLGGPSSVYGIGTTTIRKPFDTITNNWKNINRSLNFSITKTSDSYSSQVLYNIPTNSSGSFLEQKLDQFSIFTKERGLVLFNIKKHHQSAKNAHRPENSQIGVAPAEAENEKSVTVKGAGAAFKKDIKGNRTERTWRTPSELQEALSEAYRKSTFVEFANTGSIINDSNIELSKIEIPSYLLGASYIDDDVVDTARTTSPYGYTAINYSDAQPALRKYKELRAAVQSTIEGKQTSGLSDQNTSLYNTIQSENLRNQNELNNTLSSTGGVTIRDVSSTAFSTNTVSKNFNGDNYITYTNGIQGSSPVVIKRTNWSEASRENRVGDFGEGKVRVVDFTDGTKKFKTKTVKRADSINLTPLFARDKYFGDDIVKASGIDYNIRDLVKFKIQSILTDDPEKSNYMVFRALLTELSDSVDAKWDDIKYVGRGTPFYIYGGANRKVSLGFKVAALSAEEMQPMYSKLNYLMASLMPDYLNNVMRGPLHRLTVGNYFDAQLGKIDSISYSIPNDSPWEIALDEPEGGVSQMILPHIIEVKMDFTPIGAETQGINRIEDKDRSISYIAQNNTGRDKNTLQYYDTFTDENPPPPPPKTPPSNTPTRNQQSAGSGLNSLINAAAAAAFGGHKSNKNSSNTSGISWIDKLL